MANGVIKAAANRSEINSPIYIGSVYVQTSSNGNACLPFNENVVVLSTWVNASDVVTYPFARSNYDERGAPEWWVHCVSCQQSHTPYSNRYYTFYYTYTIVNDDMDI